MQRARVTSRVESDADHRGRRRLLAREGEIVTDEQARQRGIPEEVLEPVGPDARVSTSQSMAIGPTSDQADTEGPTDDVQADTEATQAEADTPGDAGDDAGFPRHRGGPVWELSDGSTVRGNRDTAEQAEQALHATGDSDQADTEGPTDEQT